MNYSQVAMENWGVINYGASSLVFDNNTIVVRRMNLGLIGHEIGHQWFGNIVPPKWWSYTWLNEGIAQFFQNIVVDSVRIIGICLCIAMIIERTEWSLSKLIQKLYPEFNIFERFVLFDVRLALSTDGRPAVQPMMKYVEAPRDVENMFGTVTYTKCMLIMPFSVL